MENSFRDFIRLWGYREIRTSMMDYFDIIRYGAGEGYGDSIFKVQDHDGKLLSMRGEVTTQFARMLASKMINEARIFYIANCIRFSESKTLSRREFWQAGAELVGGSEVEADAEIMALALKSLEFLGISEASLDAGNIELFGAMARKFGIKNAEGLRKALASKSVGDIADMTANESAKDAFNFLTTKRGGPEIVRELSEMVEGLEKYVSYFEQLYQLLDSYGCAGKVKLDLTTLREMGYYNGTVFEVFVGGIGVPIGGGGRYDAMMKEFGLSKKATGFAVSVDLCVRALGTMAPSLDGEKSRSLARILFREGYESKAVRLASNMRARGLACTVDRFRGEVEGIAVGKEIVDLCTGKKILLGGT